MLARPDTERQLRLRIETLEEENRQLRDQIARITGRQDISAARLTFGLTDAEAKIFVALVHCGLCEYETLQSAVYSDAELLKLENPSWAIRTYAKRIRRKTRPVGVDFKTIYSLGFEMPEEDRITARRCMAAQSVSPRTPASNINADCA